MGNLESKDATKGTSLENKIVVEVKPYEGYNKHGESRLAITNESKGKGQMIIGNVLKGLGVVTMSMPVVNFVYSFTTHSQLFNMNTQNGKGLWEWVIAGGIIVGVGFGTEIYGKIKHWYYNK